MILLCDCGYTTEHADAVVLATAILAVHASKAHVGHRIALLELPAPERVRTSVSECVVRCIAPGCGSRFKEQGAPTEEAWLETRAIVARDLVPAVVIAHHSAHEGHPMRVSYGGVEIVRSPVF